MVIKFPDIDVLAYEIREITMTHDASWSSFHLWIWMKNNFKIPLDVNCGFNNDENLFNFPLTNRGVWKPVITYHECEKSYDVLFTDEEFGKEIIDNFSKMEEAIEFFWKTKELLIG